MNSVQHPDGELLRGIGDRLSRRAAPFLPWRGQVSGAGVDVAVAHPSGGRRGSSIVASYAESARNRESILCPGREPDEWGMRANHGDLLDRLLEIPAIATTVLQAYQLVYFNAVTFENLSDPQLVPFY